MKKRHSIKPMFSLSPVEFRNSNIAGRGVFARRRFEPGDVIVPYAPKQRKVDVDDPEAAAAAETKFTLFSDGWAVIIPDTRVPGGWLCNHSCDPNSAIFSSGEGRIQCTRPISPGEEVTVFYGWVSQNEPERDICRCGAPRCRGFINFDICDEEARHAGDGAEASTPFGRKLADYVEFLRAIGQEQVEETISRTLVAMRTRLSPEPPP